MLLRRVTGPIALAGLLALGCSSSGRRDQNYGKDVGTVYEPPEAGPVVRDSARPVDGGVQDASADGAGDVTIDAEADSDR